ncbi:MAG: PEP-CTERM sorting domain-containing protein [Pirellulales bacterium]|nr:PEP-CTERM sorting domain-containing protein [Pirellulales bacterium]
MFCFKKVFVAGSMLFLVCLLSTPAMAYMYTPSAIYDFSNEKSTYFASNVIDSVISSGFWVCDDDEGTFGEPPVNGHIVLDMGEPTTMDAAWVFARPGGSSYAGAPKDVTFFYFEDDNPANISGAIDAFETDANITPITTTWSGQLDDIRAAANQVVPFDAPITKRYIGMRVDSAWDTTYNQNFQLGELAFGTADPIPGIKPVAINSDSGSKQTYIVDNVLDANYMVESDFSGGYVLSKRGMWVSQDDTGVPGESLPITGHIVLDMGSAMELTDMTIWSVPGSYTALPKEVKVFYYESDFPPFTSAPDDIEGNPDIVELWSGTLTEFVAGYHQTITFDTPVTKQYIGLRIDSGWDTDYNDNFQIEEIRLNTGPIEPEPMPGIGAVAVYDDSGAQYSKWSADRVIDGIMYRYNMWVSNDDTLEGGEFAEPVTGHIVLDMGEVTEIESATFWARLLDPTYVLGPENVTFFRYLDDDPSNNAGPLDDIEGDADIVAIWSGTLPEIVDGETTDVFFSSAQLLRYIGIRIESSYEATNFQIGEIRFNAAQAPEKLPGDADNNGVVNELDAQRLAQNWLRDDGVGWEEGDFNGDGIVDDLDASILAANWGNTRESVGVPEPSIWVLLAAMALMGLLLRGRRR